MKYLKIFEAFDPVKYREDQQVQLTKLTKLLDSLNKHKSLDKMTKELSKSPNWVDDFRYIKNPDGRWKQVVYKEGKSPHVNFLDTFPPHTLEGIYLSILGLIDVGDIMKKINQ